MGRTNPRALDGADQRQLEQLLEVRDAALGAMAHGLCVFDSNQRLLLFNRRLLEHYDLSPDVIHCGMSMREVFLHAAERLKLTTEQLESAWARRQEGLEKGSPFSSLHELPNGRAIEVQFRPMANGGWVVIHEDVTSQQAIKEELRRQFERMQQAIGSMSHGLSMFGADERLVMCNERYLQLYDLDPAVVKAGVVHRDLLAHWIERGNQPGVPAEEFYRQRMEMVRCQQTRVMRLVRHDGRVMEATSRPTPDGGWVTAHEDITEHERADEAMREQILRFDAALNHMSHGLCMIDENYRVIVCNPRYLDILGLSPDVVKPGVAMRDVLAHSVALGNYGADDVEQVYRGFLERLKPWPLSVNLQFADGRIIHIVYRPMPHGGWVATYEDVTERQRTEDRITHMARHDALTGLPNRVLFREKMDEGLTRVEERGEALAVLCLDLDNFKAVNDTLGHPIGDRLLTIVAQRLGNVVGPHATIARLGGDEFAILRSDCETQALEAMADRIVRVLDQPVVIDDHEINTGASIGIAVAPNDGAAGDHLMKCADLALYRAKADGRGRFRFFEPDMDTRLREKRTLELDLRKALAAAELQLVYQPLVRASDRKVTGMEALLRWTHAERGPVSPAEFIPIAEETGLIVPLGEWVLRQACAEAARWPDAVKVAVNLSPAQFKARALVATVTSALAAAGLAPNRLELEITEAVLLQDDDLTLAMLHQLRALGVRISMDDFGTGYSSLSYLRSFPFDKIKIDRSFISDLDRSKDSAAIIRAVAGLGASLGIATTAEGVETAEQFERVRRDGCTEVQGYYFSRPLPAAEVLELFAGRWGDRAVA